MLLLGPVLSFQDIAQPISQTVVVHLSAVAWHSVIALGLC